MEDAPEIVASASFGQSKKAAPTSHEVHEETPDPETNVNIIAIAASTSKPARARVKERPARTESLGFNAEIEDRILTALLHATPSRAASIASKNPRRFQRFVATFLRSYPMKVWDVARHKIKTCAFPRRFFETILEQEGDRELDARQRVHDLFWPDPVRRKQLVSVFSQALLEDTRRECDVALPPFVAFELCVGWSTCTRPTIVKRAVEWMLRNEMFDLVKDVMVMRLFKSKRFSYRKGSRDLVRCMLRFGSYEFLEWFDRTCPTSDRDKGFPWPDDAFSMVGTAEAAWFLSHARGGLHAPNIAWDNWAAFRRDFTD